MLLNILIAAAIAKLGFSLPQPEAAPTTPVVPTCLGTPPGVSPEFCLLEFDRTPATGHFTQCYNEDANATPQPPAWNQTMQKCLDGYNAPDDWQGQDCNGVGWYKGRKAWKDSQACWRACSPCIEWLISKGSAKGNCWSVYGSGTTPSYNSEAPYAVNKQTYCNMGYH